MKATDWDAYYKADAFCTRFTRPIIARELIGALKRFSTPHPILVELGGGGSCVFDAVVRAVSPSAYHVVDTNEYGLELIRARRPEAHTHRQSVLALELAVQADTVFSLGLIEHFDEPGTREAVRAHVRLLRPGGVAIISFPTPTPLYKATRHLAELTGKWRFPDERPLRLQEVAAALKPEADIVFSRLIWPIFLTQTLVVARKLSAPSA